MTDNITFSDGLASQTYIPPQGIYNQGTLNPFDQQHYLNMQKQQLNQMDKSGFLDMLLSGSFKDGPRGTLTPSLPCPKCSLTVVQSAEKALYGEVRSDGAGVTHTSNCPERMAELIEEIKGYADEMRKARAEMPKIADLLTPQVSETAKRDTDTLLAAANEALKLTDTPPEDVPVKSVDDDEEHDDDKDDEEEEEDEECDSCGDKDCEECEDCDELGCECTCCPNCDESSCEKLEDCEHWQCECECCDDCGCSECECCDECGNSDCGHCDECDTSSRQCTKCVGCGDHCGVCDSCGERGCDCNRCRECDEHDCLPCSHCDAPMCDECDCCQACGSNLCNVCESCDNNDCECSCEDELTVDIYGPQGADTVKVLPTNPNCEHCMGLELSGPGTGKHSFMVVHKTDTPNSFLTTCNQCHSFWIQDKSGWSRAGFHKEGEEPSSNNSLVAAGIKALSLGGKGGISTMTALGAGAALGAIAWAAAPTLKGLLPAAMASGLLPEQAQKMIESPAGQIVINLAGKRTPELELPDVDEDDDDEDEEESDVEEQQYYDKDGNPVIIAKPSRKPVKKEAKPKPAA